MLFLLSLATTPLLALLADGMPASRPGKPPVVIATIFGQDITLDQIEPTEEDRERIAREVEAARAHFGQHRVPAPQLQERLDYHRRQRLGALIRTPLFERFVRENHLEATEAEIRAFHEGIARSTARHREQVRNRREQIVTHLQRQDLTPDEKAALQEDLEIAERFLSADAKANVTPPSTGPAGEMHSRVAKAWIESWKVNKALYAKYGGRVIWQQAGPEPLEASYRWQQERERAGDFTFHDSSLRDLFYAYYTTTRHLDVKEPDPFSKPFWLMEPEDEPPYQPRKRPSEAYRQRNQGSATRAAPAAERPSIR